MCKVYTPDELQRLSEDEVMRLALAASMPTPSSSGAGAAAAPLLPQASHDLLENEFARLRQAQGIRTAEQPKAATQQPKAAAEQPKAAQQPKSGAQGAGGLQPGAFAVGARTYFHQFSDQTPLSSNARISPETILRVTMNPTHAQMHAQTGKLLEAAELKLASEISATEREDELETRAAIDYSQKTQEEQLALALKVSEVAAAEEEKRKKERKARAELPADNFVVWISKCDATLDSSKRCIQQLSRIDSRIKVLIERHQFMTWLNQQEMPEDILPVRGMVKEDYDNIKAEISSLRLQSKAIETELLALENTAPTIPSNQLMFDIAQSLRKTLQDVQTALRTVRENIAKLDNLHTTHNINLTGSSVGETRLTESKRNMSTPGLESENSIRIEHLNNVKRQFWMEFNLAQDKIKKEHQATILRQHSAPLSLPSSLTKAESTTFLRQYSAPGAGAQEMVDPLQQYTVIDTSVEATRNALLHESQEALEARGEALKNYCKNLIEIAKENAGAGAAAQAPEEDALDFIARQDSNNNVDDVDAAPVIAAPARAAAGSIVRPAKAITRSAASAAIGVPVAIIRTPLVAPTFNREDEVDAAPDAAPIETSFDLRTTTPESTSPAVLAAYRRQQMLMETEAREATPIVASKAVDGNSPNATSGGSAGAAGSGMGASGSGAGAGGYDYRKNRTSRY